MAGRRSTAPSRMHCLAAAAAAIFLLATTLGDAFVVNAPAPSVAPTLGASLAKSPVAAAKPSMVQNSTSMLSVAAAGALLCMACSGLRRSKPKSFQIHAVTCRAVAPMNSPAPKQLQQPIHSPAPMQLEPSNLIDLESPVLTSAVSSEQPAALATPQITAPVAETLPVTPVATAPTVAATPITEPATSSRRAGLPGSFVGGARRCRSQRSRTARAAFASRAEHRAVGKRLKSSPVYEVAAPSYDASTVRHRIQQGLRFCPSLRSETGRESKRGDMREGYDMITGLQAQANEFWHCLMG